MRATRRCAARPAEVALDDCSDECAVTIAPAQTRQAGLPSLHDGSQVEADGRDGRASAYKREFESARRQCAGAQLFPTSRVPTPAPLPLATVVRQAIWCEGVSMMTRPALTKEQVHRPDVLPSSGALLRSAAAAGRGATRHARGFASDVRSRPTQRRVDRACSRPCKTFRGQPSHM